MSVSITWKTASVMKSTVMIHRSPFHIPMISLHCQEKKNPSLLCRRHWIVFSAKCPNKPAWFSVNILSFIAIYLAEVWGFGQSSERDSRQVSKFRKNPLFLPILKINRNKFVWSKWLVSIAHSFGKGRNLSKDDWSMVYIFFAYMAKDLVFSFSLIF